MCKLWATERSWRHIDETMQIRGGRGYETAQSLAARGEEAVPVERLFRDSRINTIFEGSSEIMRLFIAREALDPHLKIGAPVLNTQLPFKVRAQAVVKSAAFYSAWYPRQWLPFFGGGNFHRTLAPHVRYAARTSQRLARRLFHAMIRFGPKLEREQILLGRFVDIGTELFAMAATCARAQTLADAEAIGLADYFCTTAKERIEQLFQGVSRNSDCAGYKVAQRVLKGDYEWVENGIL
jgi:hypothetical protein